MRLLWFNLKTDKDDPVLSFGIDWINAAARRVESIDVVTMEAGDAVLEQNVRLHSVGKEHGHSEARRLFTFYRIVGQLLRERAYDVCFAHMMPLFAVMAYPLLRLSGVPIVLWYAHGHISAKLRLAERLVESIVTSSPEGCRLQSGKICVIGQGIDLDQFPFESPSTENGPLSVLFVGRIARSKGIGRLVEACAAPAIDGVVDRIVIVGAPQIPDDRTYCRELVDMIERKGLNERVEWVGSIPRPRLSPYYVGSDVLVNPSSTGSMDKTVLEAMASGTMVITSNEAYDTDAFRTAGGVFAQHDAGSLAKALQFVRGLDAAERLRRGRAGRRWVEEEHGQDALIERLLEVLNDVSMEPAI